MTADLTVGIDIGMTGTGVAYSVDGFEVESLRWGDKQHLKVPTRLAYSLGTQSTELLGWGLNIPDVSLGGIRIEEWFKTKLGRNGVDQNGVERPYEDYMTCLYKCLRERFTLEKMLDKPWEDAIIHFLFTTPATWDPKVVGTFKALASKAGFDKYDGHAITVSLTEPEAVAAFELCKRNPRFQAGENILIVDVGGATGDFCLLRVEDDSRGCSRAYELDPVTGSHIGSTYIDAGFQALAESLLGPFASQLDRSIGCVAWELRNADKFQDTKHSFKPNFPEVSEFSVRHLAGSQSIVLRREKLKGLFDDQIELIEGTMNDLAVGLVGFERLPKGRPTTSLDYLLLSGGLGSSEYLIHRLTEFCASSQILSLKNTKVVVSSNPRLAVCEGVVHHALSSVDIFPRFPSRASFGIACRIPSNERLVERRLIEIQAQAHRENRQAVRGEYKIKWFEDCVDWFIRKGDEVPQNRIVTSRHSAIFRPDDEKRTCIVDILVTLEDDPSPFRSNAGSRTQTLEAMQVDLSGVESGLRIRHDGFLHKLSGKKAYVQVDFIIEATIGLAEANFTCFEIDRTRSQPLNRPVRLVVNDLQPLFQGLAELEA